MPTHIIFTNYKKKTPMASANSNPGNTSKARPAPAIVARAGFAPPGCWPVPVPAPATPDPPWAAAEDKATSTVSVVVETPVDVKVTGVTNFEIIMVVVDEMVEQSAPDFPEAQLVMTVADVL